MRISMAKRENSPKIEANDMVMKALSLPAAESEFQSAKQIIFGAIQTGDVYDRWLDVDTFKIDSPSKWVEKASAVSVGSVNDVLSRIKNQPIAAVVISPPATVN